MKQIVKTESPEVVAALIADMAEHIATQKSELEKIRAEQIQRDQRSFDLEE